MVCPRFAVKTVADGGTLAAELLPGVAPGTFEGFRSTQPYNIPLTPLGSYANEGQRAGGFFGEAISGIVVGEGVARGDAFAGYNVRSPITIGESVPSRFGQSGAINFDVQSPVVKTLESDVVPNSEVRLAELSQEGHALARHGGAVTDEQLITRAYTGVAPDGSRMARGRTPDSTAFFSDDHLVNSDQFLRQNYLDDAIANAAPGQLRLKVSGDMGVPVGRGYLPVGKTQGLSGPLLRVDNITNVEAWYVHNPVTKTWQTNTIYPLARP